MKKDDRRIKELHDATERLINSIKAKNDFVESWRREQMNNALEEAKKYESR